MSSERKHHSPEEKVAILRRHLTDRVPVSTLCDEYQFHPTVFYRWLKQFFENGAAAFGRGLTEGVGGIAGGFPSLLPDRRPDPARSFTSPVCEVPETTLACCVNAKRGFMRICHVVGARPNFMKAAPVIRALSAYPVEQVVVHTGQHYNFNMSDVFFQQLGMPAPDINLQVGSDTHAQQTAQIMSRFEPVLLDMKPDLVVVYGDVNSTVAAALVCSKRMIRIAHVEAGLRSFDRTMPEEINRLLTDQLSDLLFTPSEDGNLNLSREGISPEKVFFVGNVMIDTLARMLPETDGRLLPDLPMKYALVTLHRPSNVDDLDWLAALLSTLEKASQELAFVFPVHPRTRQKMAELGITPDEKGHIRFLEPLPYLEFLALLKHATVVITDSGGIQEETTFLGVPCLTVRENTERPITISMGTNILVGRNSCRLIKEMRRVLDQPGKQRGIPPLWDGHAAERIARVITRDESRTSKDETPLPAELHEASPWEKADRCGRTSRAGGGS